MNDGKSYPTSGKPDIYVRVNKKRHEAKGQDVDVENLRGKLANGWKSEVGTDGGGVHMENLGR